MNKTTEPNFRGFAPESMEARRQGRMLNRHVDIIRSFLAGETARDAETILELGAGTGQVMGMVSSHFPGFRFTAVEPVAEYVAYARQRYTAHNRFLDYREGTVDTLTYEQGSIDCAYSINIWHHVSTSALRASAAALARALKDGGRYLMVEPNFLHPYIFLYQGLTKDERNFFPWRELAALKKFFTVEKVSYYFAYPECVRSVPPLMEKAELVFERCPVLAGSVAYILAKRR